MVEMSDGVNEKKKLVSILAEKMKDSKAVLIASTKNLPSSQFQEIKKSLRGKAEIKVAKKSIIIRSIESIEKGALQNLKKYIGADIAIFFSDLEAFELSALLSENQSPAKAKAGDSAPEDIEIEPGPTELIPGPAISELSGVGLKVAVEGGKLAIKQGAVIVKKDEIVSSNVASVLAKLNIFPMKVGFLPVAAYDAVSDKVYADIKINKEETLNQLRFMIGKSFGFAVNLGYVSGETIRYFIAKAGLEEKALVNALGSGVEKKEDVVEEKSEEVAEVKKEGEKTEELETENIKKDKEEA